jgi:predicted dehydrogenase
MQTTGNQTSMKRPSFETSVPLPANPRPIVIVGAGSIINDAHLPAYRKAGFTVSSICDLDRERAQATADAFDIPDVYTSVATAVANAPGVAVYDVAVPASVLPVILTQLPDGAGVLLQKPMGENLEEAAKIRKICRAKNFHAVVNFQLRYAPFVLAARSLIDQGAIGDLIDLDVRVTVYTPWHLWKFLEGVPCMEVVYHSIHYLDLTRSFLGEPQGIYAKIVNHPSALNMDGTRSSMILDYGDMVRVNISTNHFHAYGLDNQESYIMWEGTKGAIKAKMGLLMNYPTGVPDEFEYCQLDGEGNAEWHKVAIGGSWFPDAFIGTMASLMQSMDGQSVNGITDVDDAFRTMALVDAACRSSHSGATAVLVAPDNKQ